MALIIHVQFTDLSCLGMIREEALLMAGRLKV
jgi:hypothetical protein